MLHIWVGRAGSGKSRRVLEAMEKNRRLRRQVLLVPEHISHEAEVDLCRVLGPTASRDAEVLSFRSLSSRVLAETGGLAEFTLDNGGKLLTMRRVLQELAPDLRVFGRPSQRASFLRQLTDLTEEFYAYEIGPQALYRQVEDLDGAMGGKLRDIALIYAAYDARLRSGDFDARSRLQKLREHLEGSGYLRGCDVYLDGFSYFNRQEESILELMLRQAESVTVTLLGDRSSDRLFQNALRQRMRLERMARRAGQEMDVLWCESRGQGPLGHLEAHFFGQEVPYDGEPEGLELYQAATAFTEVEWVSQQLRQLAAEGYRWRDMGVCARNMEVYGPLLESVFRRDGIPAYISRRSDLLEKPPITMLLGALDAVTGGFDREDVFRCLKTGLGGITPDECDILENYVILWDIRGSSMWLREGDWTASPDGYGREPTERSAARLERVNGIRRRVRLLLEPLYRGMRTAGAARQKAECLYGFLQEAGVPQTLEDTAKKLLEEDRPQLAEEYVQLWAIFCGVLDQFAEILGDTELSGEEFARLLRLVLTQYSVGTIPATLDQVKVSEITRNDRHRVKCLFLLGANDHVLPMPPSGHGLLDPEDRAALQQREILLSDASFDPLDNELQNIYACLAQPTDRLTVSWPVGDVNGSQLRPSFVVQRMEKLFPRLRVTREDGSYRRRLPATALELAGEDPALRQYFRQRGDYDWVLDAMDRGRALGRGRLSGPAVEALYGRSLHMSASRMDQVKRCHFGYFMQYGLRARDRRPAGFEAPEIGTFIHYLLENVAREVKTRGGWAAVQQPELRQLVREYTDRYAREEIDGYQEKSARFRYLFSRLRTAAYAIVEDMAGELAQSDFSPVAFELGFGGKDGQLPAVTITEGDQRLSVSGKVDRVDGWLHDGRLYLRVVDYKTGKKSFDLSDLRYGLGIQMLLYLFTLEQEGRSYFGYPIVPAGVLYHPAREVILKADRGIQPEKLQLALQSALRRSGMVLSDPQVLRAMEHSALESPHYLPIKVKKDGSIADGVASAEQLGKLGRYVDRLLHQIAREIGSGSIDADPVAHGLQDRACQHCDFAAACGFQEGRGGDRVRYIRSVDPGEFWKFVEEESREEGSPCR
jgi:ATP-dependent helicase/nuclease subunit B